MAGILLAVPLAARAQNRVYRIGCVPDGALAPRAHQWDAFRRGLRELGYVEGQNIVLEFREPKEGVPADALIFDLVRSKVNVIVASTALQIHAAKRVTKTIPIVMTGTTDPVAAGLVSNLARPEGRGQLDAVADAARRVRVEIVPLEARGPDDLATAFRSTTAHRVDGVVVATAGLFYGLRAQVMDLLRAARLPAVWGWESFGEFGALMVYGPSDTEGFRRAASYVDRLLKGARPADLPIQQPQSSSSSTSRPRKA